MRLPVQETLPADPWELDEGEALEVPVVVMEAEAEVEEEEAGMEEEGEATRTPTGEPPAPEVSTLLR